MTRTGWGLLGVIAVVGATLAWALWPASLAQRIAEQEQAWAALDPATDRGPAVLSLAVSPDGTRLAVGGMARTILMFDATTGAALPAIGPEAAWVTRLAWSGDGQWLASVTATGQLLVHDAVAGTPMHASVAPARATAVAFHPTRPLATWGDAAGVLTTVDLRSMRGGGQQPLGGGAAVTALAWSGDGGLLAVGFADGAVDLLDGRTQEVRYAFPPSNAGVVALAFASADRALLAVGSDRTVRVWDARHGTLVNERTATPGRAYDAVGVRQVLIRVGSAPEVDVIPFAGGAGTLAAHDAWPRAVAASADGARVATGDEQGTVVIWSGDPLVAERVIEVGALLVAGP